MLSHIGTKNIGVTEVRKKSHLQNEDFKTVWKDVQEQHSLVIKGKGVKGDKLVIEMSKNKQLQIEEQIKSVLRDQQWLVGQELKNSVKGHSNQSINLKITEMCKTGVIQQEGQGTRFSPFRYRLVRAEGKRNSFFRKLNHA